MKLNNYGYACINMQLSNPKKYGLANIDAIRTNRAMVKRTFAEKGIDYASELSLKNCYDLYEIIKWNKEHGFIFFRVSSDMFPWCSEYEINTLPDYDEIKDVLFKIGDFSKKNKMRLTSHPGPFNVLVSPKEHVVKNCIDDLSKQAQVFDLMSLSRTHYNKINIHIGGAYGDRVSALQRFCKNFYLLPESVKSRLTIENDDRASLFSVKDLYDGIYRKIGIPIVFDYHHHKFCDGGLTERQALELAISTWKDICPVVHYSESRSIEQGNDKIKPHAHSDYVYDYIDTYGNSVDIMIEAKHKELAVLKYLELNNNNTS